MSRAGAALLLAALAAPACATVVRVDQPNLDRELAAALEARRLDVVVDRVLSVREGVVREAADLGRIDRVERAAAARAALAELAGRLDAVHRGRLDREGRVDLDLARFLLEQAGEEIRLADGDEERIAALAGPAKDALAWTPLGAPPPSTVVAVLLDPGFLSTPPGPPEGARTAADLRAAAARLRQAAEQVRRLGDEVAMLHPGGEDARKAAKAAAERALEFAKHREEDAKSFPGGGEGGFAPAFGRERWIARMRTEHGVDATPEGLEAFGRELLARTTRELEDLAAAHFPGRTWPAALEEIRADHAPAADMAREAQAHAEAARDFCLERGLVTIPPAARLGHIELVGEDMARSYPYAAYGWRRATPEGESGRYLVSPGAGWMDAAQREQRLRGNCRAWTRVVSAHETWPGHHLQFWYADHESTRLRRAAMTPVFVEGWGLYCEGLLDRHGYFRTPAERLALLAMRAWRACRVVLDARLHCGGMTPEEGIEFLVANAAQTRDGATAEVTRYMSAPTQPFSYAFGWREIEALRADEERRLGERFSEREFHDRLLRCGPIPMRFVRRLFGYGTEDALPASGGPTPAGPP